MTELTTSRVNRLLRPLKNKCNSLAALPKPATALHVTYSKQTSNWDPDNRPPLTVLCPPAGTKKLAFDRRSADEFELSRRIYAVCDAFKNIAYVAFGQPCSQRIPSLAAMCTLVIGRNIATAGFDSTSVDSGGNTPEEHDLLDINDIYEAVPPHYRRFLIVSHALSMILCICTHHHTLVTTLLDHCLSFGLVHESTHLLNIMLAQALLPSNPSYPPPLMHPAHTNYLLDLHAKWITGNKAPATSSASSLFATPTFCEVVLRTLSQSSFCDLHIFWSSKVWNRLLHVVESRDLDSYILIIHALSRGFWEASGSSPDAIRENSQTVMLRDKLSELMSNLFDLLFTQSDSLSSPLTSPRLHAVIDILHECYTARLHCSRMSIPGSPIDLTDIIIIFTAHILATFRNSIDDPDLLLAILDDSSPVPTTFSKLMVHSCQLSDGQAFGDFMEAFFAQLWMYSSALCSEKLFGLDASLWACALRHFETSIPSSQKSKSPLVTRYKQQFMEAVDAAERRCFGRDIDSSPVVAFPVRFNRANRTKRGRLSGHWEWEDMVGSWIRKTPVHKKQKINNDHPHTPLRHSHSRLRGTIPSVVVGSTLVSAPLSTTHRRLPTLSPSSSSHFSELDPGDSEYQNGMDKENCPRSPPVVKESRSIRRRSSNFFSLIADAQVNRIVLHPKSSPERTPPASESVIYEKYVPPLSSQQCQRTSHEKEQNTNCRKPFLPAPSRTLLLSDDSLDLFAYATSSPARD